MYTLASLIDLPLVPLSCTNIGSREHMVYDPLSGIVAGVKHP